MQLRHEVTQAPLSRIAATERLGGLSSFSISSSRAGCGAEFEGCIGRGTRGASLPAAGPRDQPGRRVGMPTSGEC